MKWNIFFNARSYEEVLGNCHLSFSDSAAEHVLGYGLQAARMSQCGFAAPHPIREHPFEPVLQASFKRSHQHASVSRKLYIFQLQHFNRHKEVGSSLVFNKLMQRFFNIGKISSLMAPEAFPCCALKRAFFCCLQARTFVSFTKNCRAAALFPISSVAGIPFSLNDAGGCHHVADIALPRCQKIQTKLRVLPRCVPLSERRP